MRELFEYWLNIMDPPSRYFLKTLSFFVSDPKRAEKLREFASKTSVSCVLSTESLIGRKVRVLSLLREREAHSP